MPTFRIKNVIFCDENTMDPEELKELREQFIGDTFDADSFIDASDDDYHDEADYDDFNNYDPEGGSLYQNLEYAFADYYRAEGINIYAIDYEVVYD